MCARVGGGCEVHSVGSDGETRKPDQHVCVRRARRTDKEAWLPLIVEPPVTVTVVEEDA